MATTRKGVTPKGKTPPKATTQEADAPSKRLAATYAASALEEQDGEEVGRVRPRPKVTTGKPKRLPKVASMKLAYGGGGGGGMGNAGISDSGGGNWYSPELSTDFLQMPQSLYEQYNFYRFFARRNPFVKQALKLHVELPLSKVKLNLPKAKSRDMALASTQYCEAWAKRVGLLRRLMSIVRDYHLIGVVNIFAEDNNPECPDELLFDVVPTLLPNGEIHEERREREDKSEAIAWMKRNYKGWTSLRVLPPEQVHAESFSFTDEKILELIPDAKTKRIIQQADAGDPNAVRIVKSMPREVVQAVLEGTNIPLNTDPDAGSFVYVMEADKSDYEPVGQSMLESCLPTLVQWDKLRQANASIASRHMTPIRVVWAEDMDAADVEALREQVDLALQDPDFSIVANFEIHWEEMGSDQRLLDLTSEMDIANRELYAGLGVTEGLLTGETSYADGKISLEVIHTRYMLIRELLQDYVEEFLFKPMCRRMGFLEQDDDGNEVVVYPKLSFTRLALRDTADTFDAMFNLYQKGSLDVETILELLNIDPVAVKERLEASLFGVNDSAFNEVLRGLYGEIGRLLGEKSDAVDKVAANLKLNLKPEPKDDRYGR